MSRERTRTHETRGPRTPPRSREAAGPDSLPEALGVRRETTDTGGGAGGADAPVGAEAAVAILELPETRLSAEEAAARQAEIAAAAEALAAAGSAGGVLEAFADAPPSVKARAQGSLGGTIGAAEETAGAAFAESLPAFPVRMGGEPLVESVPPVSAPAPTDTRLEAEAPPAPELPELATGETPERFDANASVTSGVARAFGPEGSSPEDVAGALRSVSTTDPGFDPSPGPAPTVPLTPGTQTDPGRLDGQRQQAEATAGQARTEAMRAVVEGPGPEQARLKDLHEEKQLGEQGRPRVEAIAGSEGATAFTQLALPEEVVARFDADAHDRMQASMSEARQQVSEAETQRDRDREMQLATAEQQRRQAEQDADREQRDRVREARTDIQTERQQAVESQQRAVADLERDAEAERGTQREQIDARVRQDEQTIADSYADAERDADREVADGERRAERAKADAESEAQNESWWDKAVGFVQQAFAALTAVINDIFDGVRSLVQGILDRVREAARTLIAAAAEAIKGIIGAYGDLLKRLVDALLGDIFPGLARDLTAAIDTVVARVNGLVDAVAERLTQAVDAIIDGLQGALNAILDLYQSALSFALGTLQAALTGDWGAVFERVLEAVLGLLGIDPLEFYALVARARDALGSIIENPGQFLANLVDAVLLGFRNFADNFLTHLRAGVIAWLTGALGDIQLPEQWDIWGVLDIARQVLGLTWDWVRERAARLIGEENVARLEYVFGYIATLVTEGWAGIFQRIRDQLSDLKDLVLGQIKEFLLINVIQAGITWLASLFSPVGALVKAIQTIWNVYTFLRDQLARMYQIVRSVIESIDRIVRGVLDAAAQQIESVLGNLVPVAIDLVAKLIGITGVAAWVREMIQRLRDRITAAVDRLLERVLSLFRGGGEGDGDAAEEAPAADAEGATDRIEIGERLPVEDPSGAGHTLTIERRGADAVPTLRSDPSPVATWLVGFQGRLPELLDDTTRASATESLARATTALSRLDPLADAFLREALAGRDAAAKPREPLDVSQVDAVQLELRAALVTLFKVFGTPGDSRFAAQIEGSHEKARYYVEREVAARAEKFKDAAWKDVVAALRGVDPFTKPMAAQHAFGRAVREHAATLARARAEENPALAGDEGIAAFVTHLAARIHDRGDKFDAAFTELQDAMLVAEEIPQLAHLAPAVATAAAAYSPSGDVDPDLRSSVSGKIDEFLLAVASGRPTFGLLTDLQVNWRTRYWGEKANRDWLKARFRKSGGQHEWLPTNYVGKVIDRALADLEPDNARNAERWVIFQTTFRTETKVLFFSPRQSDLSRTVNHLRDPVPPHAETARGASYKVLQGHVGAVFAPVGEAGYVDKVQAQTKGTNRWHDDFRAIFDDHAGAATALTGITAIMTEMAEHADRTLWDGKVASGDEWSFGEYYAQQQGVATGNVTPISDLASRAGSAREKLGASIRKTTDAVLEARLP